MYVFNYYNNERIAGPVGRSCSCAAVVEHTWNVDDDEFDFDSDSDSIVSVSSFYKQKLQT